jgi:hypothetical protein
MAITILIVSGKFLSFKNDGTPNAAGKVYFFDPGTSTPKTTYSDSDLSVANAHPVILDAAGRATIYFSGDADITVKDADDVTLYTQGNINPEETAVSVHYSTATTLTSADNGKWITTTADITLPTALAAGSGWQIHLKNLSTDPIDIIRTGSGDTLNSSVANLVLPPNGSVAIITNDGVTGFDIFYNTLIEIGTAVSGQVLGVGTEGPEWQTVDLVNAGSDLYLYANFT